MDIYWTKENYERQNFNRINLFQNHLEKAFVDVTLRGKQMTIQNSHLIADDLGTQGCYPKAWIRKEAAVEAVKQVGLNQIKEISPLWFQDASRRKMFYDRLNLLRENS